MAVAIIGAGMSGLTCARELAARGITVIVFEKSRGIGGRIASRRVGGTVVDHGTPILPEVVVREGLQNERVEIAHPSGSLVDRVFTADTGPPGFAFASGLTRLAKAMADGLEIRTSTRVAALRANRLGFEIGDEQGNTHGTFDSVVISAPAPQAADLLDRSPEPEWRAAALREVIYDPCVVVIAGMRVPEPSWFMARPGGDLVASIATESAKGRPPSGGVVPVVARLTRAASERLLDASDEAALANVLPGLQSALGGRGEPAWAQVKRWRYSQPQSHLDFDAINPPESRVLICGDTTGAGVAGAARSGHEAAERLLALK